MQVRKKTYVQYILPSFMMQMQPPEPQEVESRNWEELDVPPGTQALVFYDEAVIVAEEDGIEFEWPSLATNPSANYFVNAKALTLEEFREEFAGQEGIDEYVAELEKQDVERIILTNANEIVPYTEDVIFIEIDFGDPDLEIEVEEL